MLGQAAVTTYASQLEQRRAAQLAAEHADGTEYARLQVVPRSVARRCLIWIPQIVLSLLIHPSVCRIDWALARWMSLLHSL
jgi:hypothetical protein